MTPPPAVFFCRGFCHVSPSPKRERDFGIGLLFGHEVQDGYKVGNINTVIAIDVELLVGIGS